MSVPDLYIVEKPLALQVPELFCNTLPGVECALLADEYFPKDGQCKTFLVKRDRSQAEIITWLGEPESALRTI